MKRILTIAGLLMLVGGFLWADQSMSVQVKTSPVRSTPSFFGAVIVTLSYGEQVTVLEEGNGWYRVRSAGGDTGWMQQSALSAKEIAMSSGGSTSSGVSSSESAAAISPFSEATEQAYRDENDLDYDLVDQAEELTISLEDIVAFLDEGDLNEVVR